MQVEEEQTTDLRKIRTRKAIIQAFEEIIQGKEFDAIRISDISKKAMINRVTFYHHFEDKYELLEVVTRESLKEKIEYELEGQTVFDQEMMKRVFIALTKFHSGFDFMCERSYDDMVENVERILREEVRKTFDQALKEEAGKIDENEREVFANMISWIIYGAAFDWRAQSHLSAEIYYEKICQTFQVFLQERQLISLNNLS